MAAPTIFRTDAIGVIGDSISYGFGQSDGWWFPFTRAVRAKYPATTVPARPTGTLSASPRVVPSGLQPATNRQATGYQAQVVPSYLMDASPGRKVGDVSGIMNTVLAPFIAGRVTVYFVQLGENDVPTTPAATFVPQVNAVRDAIRAAPWFRVLIWCSPFCTFEDWPDGANGDDLVTDGMKDKETQIGASMAAFPSDCFHVSWRQLRLTALNATTNPGHLTQGVYTYDGAHPTNTPQPNTTISGGDLLANYTASQLSFA